MKVALGQMEVLPGMPKKNLETMLRMIDDAKKEKADLIVFPEMCVGGYLLGDKWLSDEYCRNLMSFNEDIRKASEGIAIAYGNVYVDSKPGHPNKDGRPRKYNAIYVFQNGKAVKKTIESEIIPSGIQPKTLLPNYRIFDDERYFFSLKDVERDYNIPLQKLLQPFILNIKGKEVPVGFELCEDLWCEDYRQNGQALNPTKMLINNGAKYVVNLSASPWTFGKNATRDRKVKFLKQESGNKFVPFFYVNTMGAQNNGKNIVTFDGGSTVYNKNGDPVRFSKAPYLEELLIVEDKDLKGEVLTRPKRNKIAQKFDAIIKGIRHMDYIMGRRNGYIIGMSGGIDSAVVTALLTLAVGRKNVIGINMPTRYNSQKTKDSAEYEAKKLGIRYGIIPIEAPVESIVEALEKFDADGTGRKLSTLNKENVQAKVRGTDILSNFAAKYGYLFTNNGNKLETALGYATLYGDVGGAIAPIADLTKTEIVVLAKFLNKEIFKDTVIPETVIPDKLWKFRDDQIQPSAELKEKQVDPMKFGYHCALLDAMTDYKKRTPADILRYFMEGTLHTELDNYLDGLIEDDKKIAYQLMQRWNVTNPTEFVKDLEWFDGLVNRNVFKRIQAPPIIITSKSAYGFDIRESVLPSETTREYDQLKEQVLRMKEYKPKEN